MNRSIALLGRLGTSLLATGLALALVSLLPTVSIRLGTSSGVLTPDSFAIPFGSVYSARLGISINVETNSSLDLFIVNTDPETIYNWTHSWYTNQTAAGSTTTTVPTPPPGLFPSPTFEGGADASSFEAYLQEHERQLVWEREATPDSPMDDQFTPTEVGNYSFAIMNAGTTAAFYQLTISQVSAIAPKIATTFYAQLTIPLGLLLSAPWVLETFRMRKRSQPATAPQREALNG